MKHFRFVAIFAGFGTLLSLGVFADGKVALASDSNTVITTINLGAANEHRPRDFVFSPDGSRLYVATDKSVRVINTATNAVVSTIATSVNGILVGIAISPDGGTLYTANDQESSVAVIDTATEIVSTVNLGFNSHDVVVSLDGSTVYFADYSGSRVRLLQTSDNSVLGTQISVGGNASQLELSPDGSRLYVLKPDSNDDVSVINTATNSVVATVSVGSYPYRMASSPDGNRLYVSNLSANSVSVIDTATNSVERTITGLTSPVALSVTPDNQYLYVGQDLSSNHTAVVISLGDDSAVDSIPVGDENRALAISSDGLTVYVANYAFSSGLGNQVSITVIRRVLPSSGSGSDSSRGRDGDAGVPGIHLSVQGRVGELTSDSLIGYGAFLVAPNAPYILSLQGASHDSPQRILSQGTTNDAGHLEREITLGALSPGSHKVVLVSRGSGGELLTLTNVISVGAQGRFASITPEEMQPRVR